MHISYAQRLEDYHLAQVFAGQPAGVYVDVGGGHPVADNVTLHFYLAGWRGLVVEPQARLARLYAHIRPRDSVAETLVGRVDGETTFYEVATFHGFSTSVEANARAAAGLGGKVTAITRPVSTLASLCRAHAITAIDILKIDVEGAEADVLAGHDWRRVRPKVVVVEAVAPGTMAPAWQDWEPDLLGHGYAFVFTDELNRFYVADEAAGLAARFPARPADWTAVEHPYDYGRALDNPDHPDRALAMALSAGLMALAPTLDRDLLGRLLAAGGAFDGPTDAVKKRLLGASAGAVASVASDDPAVVLDSDAFRIALGRIAARYDGGLIED